LRAFRAKGRHLVVLNHMIPAPADAHGSIASALEDAFRAHCPTWKAHSEASISSIMTASKVNAIARAGMHTIEAAFPGRPVRFPADEGWSRITYGVL
jgi:hypothetical protein